jgi:DNA uptake protein ComE-like DNA-binding protein
MKSENKKTFNLWVVLTLCGIFNFILFYYAGIKSKSGKYIKIGHFYLLLALLSLILDLNILFIKNTISWMCFIGYIFGLVFSFKTSAAYTQRLTLLKKLDSDTLKNKKIYSMDNQTLAELADRNSVSNVNSNIKTSVFNKPDTSNSYSDVNINEDEYLEYTGEKIKINSDPEEKILNLPFITNELARKIILERKLGSGFKNKEDLQKNLGLSTRNAEIISKRIDFSF